jgi:zinc transporter 9
MYMQRYSTPTTQPPHKYFLFHCNSITPTTHYRHNSFLINSRPALFPCFPTCIFQNDGRKKLHTRNISTVFADKIPPSMQSLSYNRFPNLLTTVTHSFVCADRIKLFKRDMSVFKMVSRVFSKKPQGADGDAAVQRQTPLLVYSAIVSNVVVCLAKVLAFAHTGSGAIFSEVIHSLADIANQCLLAIGLKMSNKAPTAEHPYGFVPERFVFALISAVGIFFLGCGASVYHGISGLLSPAELGPMTMGFLSLGTSFCVEGLTFLMAMHSLREGARTMGMPFWNYIKYAADPMQVAVFCEDGAAVLGVSTAFVSLLFTHYTGSVVPDSIGSILIGGLLGATAIFLIQLNRRYLNYRSIPREHQARMLAVLDANPLVRAVHDVKAVAMGGAVWRFKAEVTLDGSEITRRYMKYSRTDTETIVDAIRNGSMDAKSLEKYLQQYGSNIVVATGKEVGRIEHDIRQKVPEARHVDIVHSIPPPAPFTRPPRVNK